MKKSVRVKLTCMVLSLVMMALSACGGSNIGEDDPNLGVYEAKTAEMSGIKLGVKDVFEDGFTIELKKKGKAHLQSGDEGGNFKWTLEGDRFHGEGGGATFDGTLKDGVLTLENVQDSGVTLTLVCDAIVALADKRDEADGTSDDQGSLMGDATVDKGDQEDEGKKDADGSMAGKLGSMLDDSSDAGKWDLYTVTQNGKAFMQDELKAKGIEAWIEMNPDGTGRINLIGDLMDMEWGDGKIIVPENSEGERDEYRYSFANEFLVLVDEDMTLAFIRVEDSAVTSDADPAFYNSDAEMSPEFMKRYEGDWHGLLKYSDPSGDTYADYDGKKCDVIARICLDEDGNVTPFFAAAMKDDPGKYNFRNVTAELDPSFDGMYISGEYLDGGSFDTEFVDEKDGFIFISMMIKADNGDSVNVTIGMKRPDAKWTDDDYPRYPDEGVEFYKGKSLEEVLSTFGNPPKGMPGQTHVTDWE